MKNGYKKNKLQQIRGFCTVIEEGSILKASKKMNTAQSNISLQVSSLEKTLGISLFKRENQRLFPTPEALRFYKVCKKALNEVDFLFENAGATIKQDYDNIVRFAGHSYMLSHILPPYFKKMIKQNPKVKFEIHNSGYTEAMDMLETGIIDFAVLPETKEDLPKNIILYEFYKCKFGIGMHENHPLAKISEEDITWDLLSKHDVVTLEKGLTTQGGTAVIKNYGINSRFSINNGNWEICMGLVKEGLTISGADIGYSKWHNDIIVKNVSNLMPKYQFNILVNTKTDISKSSKEFLQILGYLFGN
jgi:DNA-binding transcriptional LysR family regulator